MWYFERLNDYYYSYTPYQIWTGYQILDSVKTEEIDKSYNIIKSTTSYVYNTNNLLPSTVKTTNSKQEISILNIKYPLDYSITGTASNPISLGVQHSQNDYVINVPIEKFQQVSDLNGSNLRTVSSVFTTYKTDASLPETVYVTENNASMSNFSVATINSSAVTMDMNYKPKVVLINIMIQPVIYRSNIKQGMYMKFIYGGMAINIL